MFLLFTAAHDLATVVLRATLFPIRSTSSHPVAKEPGSKGLLSVGGCARSEAVILPLFYLLGFASVARFGVCPSAKRLRGDGRSVLIWVIPFCLYVAKWAAILWGCIAS